ncbi:MAG: MopE-related protein [Myxococcota bacterium]
MTPCSGCHRHLRDADATCPFCNTTRTSAVTRAFNAVGGAVTVLVLAACYGGPADKWGPYDDTGETGEINDDPDGDGYGRDQDCDPENAAINPGMAEDCTDGLDNECDGKIDAEDSDCAVEE